MARQLKWATQADLAIRKTPTVPRKEYLDYMTFQANDRPLFTEIFGPIVGRLMEGSDSPVAGMYVFLAIVVEGVPIWAALLVVAYWLGGPNTSS